MLHLHIYTVRYLLLLYRFFIKPNKTCPNGVYIKKVLFLAALSRN